MSSEPQQEQIPNKTESHENQFITPSVAITKPTPLEVFLGQYFDRLNDLKEQLALVDKNLAVLEEQNNNADKSRFLEYRNNLQKALNAYQLSPKLSWIYQWSLLFFLLLIGITEAFFIHLYCLWHGANFLSLGLYNQTNINVLSKIGFVNGATTMSIAAEVLMWSSLGAWAQKSFENTILMRKRQFKFVDDGLGYIGNMMRTTSIAAIIVIILRLTKFSIFGVSLDEVNPLAFDATIGLSFLLGFFGNDSYKLLSNARQALLGKIFTNNDEDKSL